MHHSIIYFLLLVPPLIFFTNLTRNPYYFQIVVLNAGTVALWMLWLYQGLRAKTLSFRRTPLDLPLWMFLLIATVSWWGVLFENWAHPYLRYGIYNEGLKGWLFILVNSALVYYLSVNFVDDESRPRFLQAVYWAGLIAAVYGIFQYFGIELIWPKVLNPFGGRSVSTFGNPNFLSSYLVMVLPILFVNIVQSASSLRRFFYLGFFFVYFGSLLATLTRSSWVGFFAAMVITVGLLYLYERELFNARKRLIFIPLALLLVMAIIWPKSKVDGYSPTVIERLTEAKEATKTYYGAWHQRRLIWSCAWHMVIEKPLLGKGWGCFELFYPFYQGRHLFLDAYKGFRTHANNSHNEILEIWSQTGTIGFGIYLWLMVSIAGFALFLVRKLSGEKRLLAIGLTASLAGMWVDNLMNVSLHFAIPGFLFWWNAGLLANLGRNEEGIVRLDSSGRRLILGTLLLVGAFIMVRYGKNFLGEIHYFNGFKLSKSNDIRGAIPELEAAHRLQRLEVNNNYELANCYARAGVRDKALEAYREALRANAGYDEIYFNMATVLAQKGEIEHSIVEYTRSLYINPLSPESYAALGSIFLQDPDKYGAAGMDLFEQYLFFYPQNKDMWNNLGFLYTKAGKDDEAYEAYRKALEIAPDFELARKNLKVTLARLGRTDRSLERIDDLFSEVEKDIIAKNWAAALPVCERLLKSVPQSFKARFYMANIYFTVGRVNDAITQYQQALKLEPNNAAALGNLGLAYHESKQYALAQQELQKALQIDPRNELMRQKLNEINALLQGTAR